MKKGILLRACLLASTLAFSPWLLAENEIGFIERYALAADREKALGELVPGTEEYYYFHALHYENAGQKEKLAAILDQWKKRFPQSDQRRIIENREALLAYSSDPKRTLAYLKNRLNLGFNDTQEARNKVPNLPSSLDQARIARPVFIKMGMSSRGNGDLAVFRESGLEQLVRDKAPLDPQERRALLKRITRPDVPGLTGLILGDLQSKESRGFGEFPIHKQLLPEQLDELAAKMPELKDARAFVEARLKKLAPGADADVEFDPAEREAWLERIGTYAQTLPPVFNTLKAQILFLRLDSDRRKGVYDKARFTDYLKLPRPMPYVNPVLRERNTDGRFEVNLQGDPMGGGLGIAPIGNDEALVRDYFLHLFVGQEAWEPYKDFVREQWLKAVFAEAKILSGEGDAERWASLITPAEFQALKERVDIEFAPDNARFYAPGDEVSLRLFVKNTPKMIVKIYEINTLSFYLQQKRQLNTDLALDGLVANSERTQEFAESPFRRVAAAFDFPELKGRRGAWVVEFIGGGKSSRVLVRKGLWRVTQQLGVAGDMLTVLDETNTPVKNAALWMDGRKFTADEKTGQVLIPFSEKAGRQPLVVADAEGAFASFTEFEHHAEAYSLDAQFHVEREQLLARREATLVVRPTLWVGGVAEGVRVPLELLKETKLTITSTTLDGISTTKEVKEPKLESGALFTHTLAVPDRLAQLSVTLTGKVEQLTRGGEKQDLSATKGWNINGIAKTDNTSDGHLSKFGEDYVFELLGRNGEPMVNQTVTFEFFHRDFSNGIPVWLRTDEKGRVVLGKLEEIAEVKARRPDGRQETWTLTDSKRTWPRVIDAAAGETIRVPWNGEIKPGAVSLLETRGEVFAGDFSQLVTRNGAFLEIKGLKPGDFTLRLRGGGQADDVKINLFVNDGKPVGNWLVGSKRRLELRDPAPLQLESATANGEGVRIQLRNWNPYTRVHVAATRFLPEPGLFDGLANFQPGGLECWDMSKEPNLFASGRQIGDEYRYILERRYAAKFPGNLLTRPGLLLNPWEKRSTDVETMVSGGGDAFGLSAGGRGNTRALMLSSAASEAPACLLTNAPTTDLDFLAAAAPALYNLVPDAQGVVVVPRKALGDRQHIQVLAEDMHAAVWGSFALAEAPTKFADQRLERNLDPAKAFTEKKEITVLAPGQSLTLADILTSELETYDSLPGVFALYTTLSHDATLAKFAWLMQWPALKPEEKRAKYSEFACHELNFFLSRKDPEFFAKVIKPYLLNKKAKTFLDEYLVGADLRRHLAPLAYARLNAAEQALLAQRLPGEAANAARHLRELWELLPPDPDREDRLFETALRGRAMEEEDKVMFMIEKAPAPAAAPTPGTPNLPGANAYIGATMETAGAGALTLKPASVNGRLRQEQSKLKTDDMDRDRLQMGESKSKKERTLDKKANGRLGVWNGDAPAEPAGREAKDGVSDFSFKMGDLCDAESLRQQAAKQAFYRKLGPTKEWAENNYYQLPLDQQNAGLIPVNAFWRDYAQWIAEGAKPPFLSRNLAEASRNFPEMMLALAVLDLPFEAPQQGAKTDGGAFTVTAASPLLAFHKEIKPAAAAPSGQEPALLVSQNFFRQGDRYREEGNEKFDKYVTGEFLTGTVYGANIVVTNPGSAPQKVSLLLQIPQGAIPVGGSKATDSRRVRLEPYSTQTFTYFFYFPAPASKGQTFAHYPVTVAKNETAAGTAKPFRFDVVRQLSGVDTASWDYVSQYATEGEVFGYLESHNLARVNLDRVAWRCRESADFFRKLTDFVSQRHGYSDALWRYGVYHNDAPTMREWLRRRSDLACGPWFASPLLTYDPVEALAYEHLEYSPLVNPRAHRLGAEWRIANPVLREQYRSLLAILAHKPALDAADNVAVVYYLFLQDRVEEALARLRTVKAEELATRLQFDYLHAYAAFYEQNLAEARDIAKRYAEYPVERWQKLFAGVSAQLAELEGAAVPKAGAEGDKPDREKQQAALAAAEPALELKIENRALDLHWKNLAAVTVNYYLIDPEFSFSSNPFVSQDASRFSIIKPNKSVRMPLPAGKETLQAPLPEEFAKASVLVEVLGAGLRKTQAYHANTLKLTLAESYGRLEVRDAVADKPLPKAYVKVYARLRNGTVRFFKDGYTDLRGKFDYASLNSSEARPAPMGSEPVRSGGLDIQTLRPGEIDAVERLAILVLSESHGDEVREVAPPK